MEYTVESSLWDFKAWQGGEATLDVLKEKGDVDKVEELLDEYFSGRTPTETEINDILWFEDDWIAQELGYDDWEEYEYGKKEED